MAMPRRRACAVLVTMAGPLELLKFPGLFVILTKGEPAGTRIELTEGLAGR